MQLTRQPSSDFDPTKSGTPERRGGQAALQPVVIQGSLEWDDPTRIQHEPDSSTAQH